MWVTRGSYVGHIQIALWVTPRLLCGSVGQVGQQVWPTFNPGLWKCREATTYCKGQDTEQVAVGAIKKYGRQQSKNPIPQIQP